jgi:hypothetical protein
MVSPGLANYERWELHIQSQLVPETALETWVALDPNLVPDKRDSRSYLRSVPHPGDMLYDRIYSMFDIQLDCRGGGTPSKLYYEASRHLQTIKKYSRSLQRASIPIHS